MALSDKAIKAAKPKAAKYKLYDEGGLLMLVMPSGGKLWRWKYRYHQREQQLSLGRFPDVSLKEARARRDAARKQLAAGVNPTEEKKRTARDAAASMATTFESVAKELIAKAQREGAAAVTVDKAHWFLSLLKGALGKRPIAAIDARELLVALQKVEATGRHETAKRLRSFASRVFRHAIMTSRSKSNPAAELQGALTSPKVTHYAAIVDPTAFGALLRAIEDFQGQSYTKLALQLLPHVFVRPGELRHAEWSEIDLNVAVWKIPASKMKMRVEHTVPLSRQAVEILREAMKLTGGAAYVFPSLRTRSRPMSENTLNAALRRLGYSKDEMTSHGFRSTASTLLNESGKWSADAIERALAHKSSDDVRAAYHRGIHWKERVEMAQWWSDHIDALRKGATVLPFTPAMGQ